jgi:plastocyanin
MFTKTLIVLAAAAGLASAAPTATNDYQPSKTWEQPRITHTIVAGRGGLKFEPDNVFANVGEVIEWHFLPANHSVVESSFGAPCKPRNAESFFSGFFPTPSGQNPEVFQIVVKDTAPIWYYCGQTKGDHCQSGMVGVINQKVDSPATLAAHKLAAIGKPPSTVQPAIIGGSRIPNPQPLAGV